MTTPFEYMKLINAGEQTDVDDDYNQYIINMGMSFFPDTIFFANEMNTKQVSNQMHYDYLANSVRPRKRFKKWPKKSKTHNDDIVMIMHYYKYSRQKAKETLSILSDEQKKTIRKALKFEM